MRYKKADRIQGEYMEKTDFIRCPVCGNKTRDKIREDTVLKNFVSKISHSFALSVKENV